MVPTGNWRYPSPAAMPSCSVCQSVSTSWCGFQEQNNDCYSTTVTANGASRPAPVLSRPSPLDGHLISLQLLEAYAACRGQHLSDLMLMSGLSKWGTLHEIPEELLAKIYKWIFFAQHDLSR